MCRTRKNIFMGLIHLWTSSLRPWCEDWSDLENFISLNSGKLHSHSRPPALLGKYWTQSRLWKTILRISAKSSQNFEWFSCPLIVSGYQIGNVWHWPAPVKGHWKLEPEPTLETDLGLPIRLGASCEPCHLEWFTFLQGLGQWEASQVPSRCGLILLWRI